jgi:predicted transcriptional regulator
LKLSRKQYYERISRLIKAGLVKRQEALLDVMSDNGASNIFKRMAAESSSDILITRLKFSSKQYYERISRLIKAGLVKREEGRYLPTEFGKAIHDAHRNLETKIESALKDYWKFKAIDSMSFYSRQHQEEIISKLIENDEIKNILLKY